jgi:hypothetical protein
LFSNVLSYYGEGFIAPQKNGPIPLGDECVTAGLTGTGQTQPCPENGIATNGDGFTQVAQAQGHLWGAISTAISQSFASGAETHQGAAYWVVSTDSFDRTGRLSLTSQSYVSPAHEDLSMPAMAAVGSSPDGNSGGNGGGAIIAFTLPAMEARPALITVDSFRVRPTAC